MTKTETSRIVRIAVNLIEAHPDLNCIPMLDKERMALLKTSINERGMQNPLTVMPRSGMEGHYWMVDGRNRYEVAKGRGEDYLDCIVRDDIPDPLGFALENAIQGRQLTKSGIALILFLSRPDLAEKTAKAARIEAGKVPVNSINGSAKRVAQYRRANERRAFDAANSYRQLAKKYNVSVPYFSHLCRLRESRSDQEWQEVIYKILVQEIPITRIDQGFLGGDLTKEKKRLDMNMPKIATVYPGTLFKVFRNWGKWKFSDGYSQEACDAKWDRAYSVLPESHRRMVIRHMTNWGLNEREAAYAALESSFKADRKGRK